MLLIRQRGRQRSTAHAASASRGGAVGDVAAGDGFAVDRKGGARAERRRVVRALRRRCHDARESGSDEARSRARRAESAEGADSLASAADVGREAVFGAAVGRGGRAGDAVGDDELEPGDHRVLAEDDLIVKD